MKTIKENIKAIVAFVAGVVTTALTMLTDIVPWLNGILEAMK